MKAMSRADYCLTHDLITETDAHQSEGATSGLLS